MKTDLFDFFLPKSAIALRPALPREVARLLVVPPSDEAERSFEDRHIFDLPSLLRKDDVLVFNNTKVIPASLSGYRLRGENLPLPVNLLIHTLQSETECDAFAKPAKRLAPRDRIVFHPFFQQEEPQNTIPPFFADITEKTADGRVFLSCAESPLSLRDGMALYGAMPLPPYIQEQRPCDRQDFIDYQTLYAQREGAIAAPTAGLHFTSSMMDALRERGISLEWVTLHTGAGTFAPVKVSDTSEHLMHSEWGEILPDVADRLTRFKKEGRRVIAVGTTSLRILESACDESGRIHPFSGQTALFITPGYVFRAIDGLFTNFHLPKSTLFMLTCALCGLVPMHRAYAHALSSGYRFYSYGDACLLFPASVSS